jgi:hypothetical protein
MTEPVHNHDFAFATQVVALRDRVGQDKNSAIYDVRSLGRGEIFVESSPSKLNRFI